MTEQSPASGLAGFPARPVGALSPTARIAAALAAITMVGLALRLYDLTAASIWSDEAFSAHWIHRGLRFIWTDGLVIETTPPLYYMLLKWWAVLFGDSDWSIRCFSAVASTLTIPAVYLLAAEITGVAAALAAAAVFALLPMQVFYAQEARVYALVPLFFAVALLALLRFVRAARGGFAKDHPGALAGYAIGATLLIYAHATSVFTVAALSACALVLLWGTAHGRAALPRFILANLVVALLAVPQLYAITVQAGRHDLNWIKPPDLIGLLTVLDNLFIDPVTPQSLFRISCIGATLAAVLLLALVPFLRLGRTAGLLVIGVPALFLAAVIGLSYVSPFLIPRITIWIGVPIAILAGAGLVSAAPLWLRASFAVALLFCIGLGLQGTYVRVLADKEDWRGLMAELLPRLGPSDMVALGPGTSLLPLLHYADGAFDRNGRILFRWEPRPREPDLYLPDTIQTPVAVTSEAIGETVRQGRRVWVVLRQVDFEKNEAAARAIQPPPAEINARFARLVVLRW